MVDQTQIEAAWRQQLHDRRHRTVRQIDGYRSGGIQRLAAHTAEIGKRQRQQTALTAVRSVESCFQSDRIGHSGVRRIYRRGSHANQRAHDKNPEEDGRADYGGSLMATTYATTRAAAPQSDTCWAGSYRRPSRFLDPVNTQISHGRHDRTGSSATSKAQRVPRFLAACPGLRGASLVSGLRAGPLASFHHRQLDKARLAGSVVHAMDRLPVIARLRPEDVRKQRLPVAIVPRKTAPLHLHQYAVPGQEHVVGRRQRVAVGERYARRDGLRRLEAFAVAASDVSRDHQLVSTHPWLARDFIRIDVDELHHPISVGAV